jgi:Uma2 family endonuclease
VIALTKPAMTAHEFDEVVGLPENEDKTLEFIAGEVCEVPSNPYASMISARIVGILYQYLFQHDIAFVTTEAGGYQIAGTERYAPDVAVVLKARQAEPDRQGYNSIAPDITVEVEYPVTDASMHRLVLKVGAYLAAGTQVWVVYPEGRLVEVYSPGHAPIRMAGSDLLTAPDILPGFSVQVDALFPAEPPAAAP